MAHDIQTLITVVDRILQDDRVLNDHKKALVESLLEKVISLKELLEKSSVALQHGLRGSSSSKEIVQELQSEIRDAAQEAEDIIESHAMDQMLSESHALHQTHHMRSLLKSLLKKVITSLKTMMQRLLRCNNCTSSRNNKEIIQESQNEMVRDAVDCSIIEVMEKFDAANDKLTNIIKLQSHDEGKTTMDVISNPSLSIAADPTMMVGFEEDVLYLKHRLTSHTRKREIIPIVGMGGIGKTTLARNLYNDSLVVSHFDVRAWVTVSQDYNVRAILLSLLGSIFGKLSEDVLRQNESELGGTLYRRLYGKRYLVVLDDVWSEKAWDEIQRYFPKEENRSRILITSRELHVAKHPDSACEEHQMHLLSDAQSWDLLHQKVFEKDEHCPPSLEEIGRKIASDCGGLPLAICVIGGLLSVEKHSKDLWAEVARDVRSITGDHISEILCLSYDNLPLHLKPCFLYMSAFPEDYEVKRSKLVRLLVAEGFLWRSNEEGNKSLEDVAEKSLRALVDRNLLSVTRNNYNGRAKGYSMHDLLRDVCVRKAEEEKFLCSSIGNKYKKNVNNIRRASIQHQFIKDAPGLAEDLSCSRSLLFNGRPMAAWTTVSLILSTSRLVRLLDVQGIYFADDFPTEILKLANLRYLGVWFSGSLPSAIWRLRNLQTLVVYIDHDCENFILSDEAWEISCLRHIMWSGDRHIRIGFKVPRVHENLQTISNVHLGDLLASNLINNIPNIRKLGIYGEGFATEDRIIDLSHLDKLENLTLKEFFDDDDVLSLLKLPDCLKKLSLISCKLPMEFVNGVGDLQYLQALKIKWCLFVSEEDSEEEEEEEEDDDKEWVWELNEGVEFCSLQFLELNYFRIKRWKADYSHFPILRCLKIRGCHYLKEIPTLFAEMSTLEMIEVNENNRSHVDWANEVREVQRHEYGNETLQIHIASSLFD